MKTKTITLILIALFGLNGCKEKLTLEQKAVARWEALIAGDYEKAYEMLSSAHRKNETLSSFKLRMSRTQLNITWHKAEFKAKQCEAEADVCKVNLTLTYTYQMPKRSYGKMENIPAPITESWIKKDGEWYFVPKIRSSL